jgi:hypothetical protein
MATLSVRDGDPQKVALALVAASMALTNIDDKRDAIVVFGPVFDSIKRAGLDAGELFAQTAELVPPASGFLQAFLERSPEEQSLEAMGYVEASDADGFCYKMSLF